MGVVSVKKSTVILAEMSCGESLKKESNVSSLYVLQHTRVYLKLIKEKQSSMLACLNKLSHTYFPSTWSKNMHSISSLAIYIRSMEKVTILKMNMSNSLIRLLSGFHHYAPMFKMCQKCSLK